MNLSLLFIKRPVMTTLVMLAIAVLGIFSYFRLPVSDLPSVDYPTIQVNASYPGASPETMANNVASPLEKAFTELEKIKTITSTSSTGETTIVLQFDIDRNLDSAATDVISKINQASSQLPTDLPFAPTFRRINPAKTPIMYLVFASETVNPAELYKYAINIAGREINVQEGVGSLSPWGSPFAVRIQIDPQKLAARGIGINEVAARIAEENVNKPVGTLYGKGRDFLIAVDGQMDVAEKFGAIILKTDNGSIIRVRDVGTAFASQQDDKYSLDYLTPTSAMPCSILGIDKQIDASATSVSLNVNNFLSTFKEKLPHAIDLQVFYDKAFYIQEAIADVKLTLILAILLVVLVLFLYLGKPSTTLIPAIAIPMSIFGTYLIMGLLGFSIDILSLLAITLSIGFLVDDAIVVLENIVRHVEMGKSPMQAAIDGSRQISVTILSMTLCLGCVFIPMIFMTGIIGKLFREFSITILVAILMSGVISLTLTPLLASLLIRPNQDKTKLEKWSHTSSAKLISLYMKGLSWSLERKTIVLSCALGSVALSLFLLVSIPKDFIPADDLGYIEGFIQSSDDTSPAEMVRFQKESSLIAQSHPAVESSISIGAYPTSNQGAFFLRLKDIHKRPPIATVMKEVQAKMMEIPGIQVFLKPYTLIDLETGAQSSKGAYQYTLQSTNQAALFDVAEDFQTKFSALPGITGVSSDLHIALPKLSITIDRDKASYYGITADAIESALGFAFSNALLSPIRQPDDIYYVILEVEPRFYEKPVMLEQLKIHSPKTGQLVALSEITTTNQTRGAVSINHLDSLPSITYSFNLDGIPLGNAIKSIEKMAKETFPAESNIIGSMQGSAGIFQETFSSLAALLLITLFIIYILLGILYENYIDPLIVMSTLPPALLGALGTLYLFGDSLSLYSFVGMIMLLGIVLKNGIILIDFANEAHHVEGKTPYEAIHEACATRFRPILMTSISAIMGAVPIALGVGGAVAHSRIPLGLAVVGGLIVSQILTLFFTPALYLTISQLRTQKT